MSSASLLDERAPLHKLEAAWSEHPVTWRMRIERQVLRLWRFFMKNEPYVPMPLTRRGVKAAIEGARAPTPDAAPTSGGPKVIRQRPPKR